MKTMDFIMRLMLDFSIKIKLQCLAQILINGFRDVSEICNIYILRGFRKFVIPSKNVKNTPKLIR